LKSKEYVLGFRMGSRVSIKVGINVGKRS
jgi:hypothetical protein